MAVYARSSSPQHQQQHGRSSTNTLMATLPDVMVDFARQMSITSDAEITAALEQQVHHQHQARCRRILDRRHSLAAMAPQQSNRPAEAPERMARLSVTRPSTARSSSATGCRSAEHLLLLSPTAARSRSPTGGRTSTTSAAPQASSQRLSVTTMTTGKTNNVTSQHHHGRSQSVRTPKRPSTATSSSSQQHHSNYPGSSSTSGAPPGRPRGTSLPSHRIGNQQYNKQEVDQEEEADYYLLRHFIVQQGSNRVVNRGDSFRQRADANRSTWMVPPRPAGSQHSSASSISTENVAGSPPQSYQPYSDASHQSSSSSRRASLLNHDQNLIQSSGGGPEPLRVLMLGASGVGKTALTAQFMTSEYLNTYEASLDDGTCDRSVSVLLDGEESQLVFIDHPHGEISVENCMSTYNPHAYVIVYSVVDGESLHRAEEILHFLWRHLAERSRSAAFNSILTSPPVILVANKIDLVRSRIVSTQAGKSLAVSFDCKYIETSSGMQHNVDELLVGILKQIRLKMMAVNQQQAEAGEGTSSTSSVRSLFRKRSAGRHHRQQNNLNPADPVDGLHPNSAANNNLGRRSTSLRVRRMLGKVWPNCADYYQNKSRSCEDLHVL